MFRVKQDGAETAQQKAGEDVCMCVQSVCGAGGGWGGGEERRRKWRKDLDYPFSPLDT